MATTIQSDPFAGYFWESMARRDNFLNPKYNLVASDEETNALEIATRDRGGRTFWWAIQASMASVAERVNPGVTLTPVELAQYAMKGIVLRDGKAFTNTNIRKDENGQDILTPQMAEQMADLIAKNIQLEMAATLKGCFLAASASSYVKNISADSLSAAILTPAMLRAIRAEKYPDLEDDVVVNFICNKAVKESLIAQASSETLKAQLEVTGKVDQLQGFNLIANNVLCPVAAGVYTSYMTFEQPFMVVKQIGLRNLEETKPGTDGGTTISNLYWNTAVGISYFSWVGAETVSPANSALEVGTNWECKAVDSQNVEVIQVKSKIVANEA